MSAEDIWWHGLAAYLVVVGLATAGFMLFTGRKRKRKGK